MEKRLEDWTVADLFDPSVDEATLAQIAGARPDLWRAVRQHPRCYPALSEWFSQSITAKRLAERERRWNNAPMTVRDTPGTTRRPASSAQADQASQARAPQTSQTPQTPQTQPAQPLQDAQQAPQVQQAPPAQAPQVQQAPQVLPQAGAWQHPVQPEANQQPGQQQNAWQQQAQQAAHQAGQQAQQLADNAKQFFSEKVSPTASQTAATMKASFSQELTSAKAGGDWKAWAPLALPVVALLSIISLFLPAASWKVSGLARDLSEGLGLLGMDVDHDAVSGSYTLFSIGLAGLGVFLLLIHLVVLALGVVGIGLKREPLRKALGVVGIAVGAISLIIAAMGDSIVNGALKLSRAYGHVSEGAGLILLLIFSLVMIAAGVVTLLKDKKSAAPGTAGHGPTA